MAGRDAPQTTILSVQREAESASSVGADLPVPSLRDELVSELILESLALEVRCPALPGTDLVLPHTFQQLGSFGRSGSTILAPLELTHVVALDADGVPRARLTWGPDGEDCRVEELDEPVINVTLVEADGEPYAGEVRVCGRWRRPDDEGRVVMTDVVPDLLERAPRMVVSGCTLFAPGVDSVVPADGTGVTISLPARSDEELGDAAGGPFDPEPEPPLTTADALDLLLERDDLSPEVMRLAQSLKAGLRP